MCSFHIFCKTTKLLAVCLGHMLLLGIRLSAADPNGFVSVDCGYNGSAYTDSSTGLTWKSDSTFYDPTGNAVDSSIFSVTPPSSTSPNYFRSLRYFTGNRTKYCYIFDETNAGVPLGSAYIVRASFWAGQFSNSPPPAGTKRSNASRIFFQIFINADPWDDVLIEIGSSQSSSPIVKEMYLVANYSSEIAVCLGGPGIPGLDSPFISALELRPIDFHADVVGTMAATSRHLFKLRLINYGATSMSPIRYPNDIFDRIWEANTDQPTLSATSPVYSSLYANPPSEVLRTARTAAPGDVGFILSLGIKGNSLIKSSGTRSYYYSMYMAEISPNVTAIGQRVFDIVIYDGYNFDISATGFDILNKTGNRSFTAMGWYSGRSDFLIADAYDQGSLLFTFLKSNMSIYGPLVNGLELLLASDAAPSAGTIATDVNALRNVKDSFQAGGSLRSWRGDPCLPYPYNWISCSTTGNPVIISLSLANRNLSGEIPSSIANLTSLSIVDLQGNKLSGSIPEFLATLPKLKLLLLQNNNFSGPIPPTLLERQSNGDLQVNVEGNQFLITPQTYASTNQRKNNRKYVLVGISIGIIALILVSILLVALCVWRKRRRQDEPVIDLVVIPTTNTLRSFSYKDVQVITKNFSRILGRGGFGIVYHGVIDNDKNVNIVGHGVLDNEVAVKVLLEGSTQGTREFLNEVDLLSRVHHRNLLRLVGYCTEIKVMLIYEYMPRGSLQNILHGTKVPSHNYHLSWRDRLTILAGAAQGISYLHNDCRPKIIHRDVKPANILIDNDMEAKISDFGISRANYGTQEGTSDFVTTVQGSGPYMAPEYINHGRVDEKTDVYAFGVVILEVISGRRPMAPTGTNQMQHIKNWVRPLWMAGRLNDIIDTKMNLEFNSNQSSMWRVLEIAMTCIEDNSTSRPPMDHVAQYLISTLQMDSEEEVNTNTFTTSIGRSMDTLLR